ncbi:MAG: hypothetical protein QW568_01255 [Candidatus Anstonellaceae archaeon]
MKYNSAFFGLCENVFLLLKNEFGKKRALSFFSKIIAAGLKKAYDAEGFARGSATDFARAVGRRDKSVGLRVKFPAVAKDRIIYQFWTDPFPNLKGHVPAAEIDRAYMRFKVQYLLGKGWKYHTTKHLWKGDLCTEHIITREQF